MSGQRSAATPDLDEIRSWGATVDLPAAGRAFGLGRNQAYELAKRDEFPVRVLKIGHRYRVVVAELLAVLQGEPAPEPAEVVRSA